MTTTKQRLTVYLSDGATLEALLDELRRLAPIAQRGQISRSTIVEAAIDAAWRDVQANGRNAAIYKSMVTLPEVEP